MSEVPGEAYEPSLRRRAEDFLRKRGEELAAFSVESAQQLVYELQVHQTELEIQNEELRAARRALESEKERSGELYDNAPVGHLDVTLDGRIDAANLSACTMLGHSREDVIGRMLAVFVDPMSREALQQHLDAVFGEMGKRRTCELFSNETGEVRHLRVSSIKLLHERWLRPVCVCQITDVTEVRLAQQALDWSWATAFDILARVDRDGCVQAVSPSVREAMGRASESLIGESFIDFLHVDDRPRVVGTLSELSEAERALTFTARLSTEEGGYASFEWRARRHPQTGVIYLAGRGARAAS